jgi:hypothetical protein
VEGFYEAFRPLAQGNDARAAIEFAALICIWLIDLCLYTT